MFTLIFYLLALDFQAWALYYSSSEISDSNQVEVVNYNDLGKGVCPKISQPLCATNGQEFLYFGNKCLLEVKNYDLLIQGQMEYFECPLRYCSPQCAACSQVNKPVCAINVLTGQKETFANPCEVERSMCLTQNEYRIISSGQCSSTPHRPKECPQFCSSEIKPVCGQFETELRKFTNLCQLEKEKCETKTNWQLVDISDCAAVSGVENECPQLCTADYKPICARYGILELEFSNMCELKTTICQTKQEWTIKNHGPCEILHSDNSIWNIFNDKTNILNNEMSLVPKPKPKCSQICTLEFNPICAVYQNDFREFVNRCQLDQTICETGQEWSIIGNGPCSANQNLLENIEADMRPESSVVELNRDPKPRCPQVCPFIYMPICAKFRNELREFPNRCVLDQTKCETKQDWQQFKEGPCPFSTCPEICTRIFKPVCAKSNGEIREFSNNCVLQSQVCKDKRDWHVVNDGPCPSTDLKVNHTVASVQSDPTTTTPKTITATTIAPKPQILIDEDETALKIESYYDEDISYDSEGQSGSKSLENHEDLYSWVGDIEDGEEEKGDEPYDAKVSEHVSPNEKHENDAGEGMDQEKEYKSQESKVLNSNSTVYNEPSQGKEKAEVHHNSNSLENLEREAKIVSSSIVQFNQESPNLQIWRSKKSRQSYQSKTPNLKISPELTDNEARKINAYRVPKNYRTLGSRKEIFPTNQVQKNNRNLSKLRNGLTHHKLPNVRYNSNLGSARDSPKGMNPIRSKKSQDVYLNQDQNSVNSQYSENEKSGGTINEKNRGKKVNLPAYQVQKNNRNFVSLRGNPKDQQASDNVSSTKTSVSKNKTNETYMKESKERALGSSPNPLNEDYKSSMEAITENPKVPRPSPFENTTSKEKLLNELNTSTKPSELSDPGNRNSNERGNLMKIIEKKVRELFEIWRNADSSEEFGGDYLKIQQGPQVSPNNEQIKRSNLNTQKDSEENSDESLESKTSFEDNKPKSEVNTTKVAKTVQIFNKSHTNEGLTKFGVYSDEAYKLKESTTNNKNLEPKESEYTNEKLSEVGLYTNSDIKSHSETSASNNPENSDKVLTALLAEDIDDATLVKEVLTTLDSKTTAAYPLYNEAENELNYTKPEESASQYNSSKKGEIYNGIVYKAPVYDAPTYNFIYTGPHNLQYPSNAFMNYQDIIKSVKEPKQPETNEDPSRFLTGGNIPFNPWQLLSSFVPPNFMPPENSLPPFAQNLMKNSVKTENNPTQTPLASSVFSQYPPQTPSLTPIFPDSSTRPFISPLAPFETITNPPSNFPTSQQEEIFGMEQKPIANQDNINNTIDPEVKESQLGSPDPVFPSIQESVSIETLQQPSLLPNALPILPPQPVLASSSLQFPPPPAPSVPYNVINATLINQIAETLKTLTNRS